MTHKWTFEARWHNPSGFLVGCILRWGDMVSIHLGPFYVCWWKRTV